MRGAAGKHDGVARNGTEVAEPFAEHVINDEHSGDQSDVDSNAYGD